MDNLRVNSAECGSEAESVGSFKVLLTDSNRWPAPARLAMALSDAGCNVSAVCRTPGHPLLKTRAVRRTFPYRGLRPLDSLTAAIEAAQPDLIIPCDDRGVQHLHELHTQALSTASGSSLRALIEKSLGAPESYPIVSSRYDLLRVASEEQIPVPETLRIDSVRDAQSLFSAQSSPWFLKADGTWGGRGVRFTESVEQAQQNFLDLTSLPGPVENLKQLVFNRDRSWLLPRSHPHSPAVIAQACVQGRPANCAVIAWQGTVLAGIAVEVLSSAGAKGPAIVVRLVEGSEMLGAAQRLASRLRLSGFFGLDFMIEEHTGATYLIEMNPRCTPLCHLRVGPGRDLVGALWAQVAGVPYRPPATHIDHDLIAYFPQAWTTQSTFLDASFQDVPHQDPALRQELLNPWSERSLLGRLVDRYRAMNRRTLFPVPHVFPEAISPAEDQSDQHLSEERVRLTLVASETDLRQRAVPSAKEN
jgi:ATP-grasp domain